MRFEEATGKNAFMNHRRWDRRLINLPSNRKTISLVFQDINFALSYRALCRFSWPAANLRKEFGTLRILTMQLQNIFFTAPRDTGIKSVRKIGREKEEGGEKGGGDARPSLRTSCAKHACACTGLASIAHMARKQCQSIHALCYELGKSRFSASTCADKMRNRF